MIETPLCVCNWHADKTHGKSKEGNKMIETNSWQKPSACDTPSRSKREIARKRCSLDTLKSRSTLFQTRYRSPPATLATQTKPENPRQFFKVYLEARF